LLVLGADHGHHRVGAQVAMLAPCPVAVLPAGHHPGASPGPVVAGVDGSESAALALRYALATAERWHTRAVAVHAWQPVTLGVHRLRQLPDSFDHLAETHGRILSRAVQRWQPAFPGTPVAEKLAIGAAHRVLLDEAARARLLVLGSHGWGSLHQATLGSVGVQILRDPPCPVVVVHPHRHAAEPVPAMQAAGDRR
ncbi:MAG TPA: universal stress protein, partial [Rugosimonospora sp.]|nr:universal stress protein [Rugosimonospora sp.]